MLENILKLDGVQELNKTEQKSIVGAFIQPTRDIDDFDYRCYNKCIKSKGGANACRRKCS